MNCLVTGATGFVGRHLVSLLQDSGHHVEVVSRNVDRARAVLGAGVIAHRWDGDDEAVAMRVVRPLDVVFHLAANRDYPGSRRVLYRDNVLYTRKLVDWAHAAGTSCFVLASTVDVLGPQPVRAQPPCEEAVPRPVSAYGWSKLLCEQAVRQGAQGGAFRAVILRLGHVYGPGSSFLIKPIAHALLQDPDHPLIAYYGLVKDRYVQPCFVQDVVEGFHRAAAVRPGRGDIVHLSGSPVTVEELYAAISQALGREAFVPPPPRVFASIRMWARQTHRWRMRRRVDLLTYLALGNWWMNTEKASAMLDFSPRVPLLEGIRMTVADYLRESQPPARTQMQ